MTRTVPVGSRFAGTMVPRGRPLTLDRCGPVVAAGKVCKGVVWS